MEDHLGSTRMMSDGAAITDLHDYLPFGEEIAAGIGSRDGTWGGAEPKLKFTGKLRDDVAESGLDYFGARYYSGAQGRFTTPDWSTTPQPVPYANLSDPQSLNLYSYVRNNPLSNVDADGHCGIWGDPNCTWGQFFQSIPQRAIGGLKVEANIVLDNTRLGQVITSRFTPSNEEQADAMANRSVIEGPFMTGLAMAIPGPKGEAGEAVLGESPAVHPAEIMGKAPAEIDSIATGKGLIPKGPNPTAGKGAYVDPVTGEQRVLIHPDPDPGHAHVNNPAGERLGPDGRVVPRESQEAHLPIKKDQQ